MENAPTTIEPWLQVQGSRHFLDWLAELRISLAFSTYQTGKIFFVGRKLDTGLAMFERTFNHAMGLWASPDAQTLWLGTKFQVWRFEQAEAAVVPYQSSAAEGLATPRAENKPSPLTRRTGKTPLDNDRFIDGFSARGKPIAMDARKD
ncbi:MAG: DUF4915 domain-containing protein [Pirellulales bacterium]